MVVTNQDISRLLRKIAASYQITGENRFRVIAYERAADSIDHLTSEVKDLWDDGKIDQIPGVGSSIAKHLHDLFSVGKVKHFEDVLSKVPSSIFPLLEVPGIGPKKAFKLVKTLKLEHSENIIRDLEQAVKAHRVAEIDSFGDKSEAEILSSIETYKKGQIKENRMSLWAADNLAQGIISFMKKNKFVLKIDVLGSMRRQVATIGDLDFSVSTHNPDQVLSHFISFDHQKLIEKGPSGASLLLHNGRQVDLRIQEPDAYGAMLQYFTGSKNHNIKLRQLALEQGLSLNEYGIKNVKSGMTKKFQTEESFYEYLGMSWIPPELREDNGEIEAAIQSDNKKQKLPHLVNLQDIRGDLHIHTNYDLLSSHDIGADSIEKYLDYAKEKNYQYIGLSDHNPRVTNLSSQEITTIMRKRYGWYSERYIQWSQKNIKTNQILPKIFILCEVDIQPDGNLALPIDAFDYVDAVVVSVHSNFTQDRKLTTHRLIKALTYHPKVKVLGHPTGRLLSKRESINADWVEVFATCKSNDIALEINANPDRLDLPDRLVLDAVRFGVRLCINTDSHAVDQMNLLKYGISVARRGWAKKSDIINAQEYNIFEKWITHV